MKNSVEAINARLKTAKMGVAVVQRGDRLSLRATLPGRGGSGKKEPRQQYLSLGIYANPAGLKVAEDKAHELAVAIVRWKGTGIFDWEAWLSEVGSSSASSVCAWIEAFRQEFLMKQQAFSFDTWERHYYTAFSRLPFNEKLTEELLIKELISLPSNSWTRSRTAYVYQRLAKFAGLNIDLSPYKGDYGPSKTKPKQIPSDEEIVAARSLFVPDSPWQWIFGILAAYGLRPHEAFFCEISSVLPHVCKVLRGKTGERTCYPLRPEWAIEWQLWQMRRPPVSEKSDFNKYGKHVYLAFYRRDAMFSPYCLRHAYAIRAALQYKIPVSVAAAWLGHAPQVYLQTYNKWISEAEHAKVFLESLAAKASPPAATHHPST